VYNQWQPSAGEGKQSLEYFKIFGKNTIFNEHPVLDPSFCPSHIQGVQGDYVRDFFLIKKRNICAEIKDYLTMIGLIPEIWQVSHFFKVVYSAD